jgi:hypothetical protein
MKHPNHLLVKRKRKIEEGEKNRAKPNDEEWRKRSKYESLIVKNFK